MTSKLDEILSALQGGQCTLDEACRAVSAAVRENPSGTRMWPMLIDSRITQGVIATATGRALIDAMESFEPERTMWLAPSKASAPPPPKPAPTPPLPRFDDTEQLRAYLWDSKRTTPSQSQPTVADAAPTHIREHVQWVDDSLAPQPKRVPPPKPMPGSIAAVEAPQLGELIDGRYRLDANLGYAGIGQVFAATDLDVAADDPDAHVTLKLVAVDLNREPQAFAALQSAVERMEPLTHDNIVRTRGLVRDGKRVFVVMEKLSGHWLGDRVRQVRKVGMPHDLAWPLIEGIANGLAFAHRCGVVHSDLSPYSIFVTEQGVPKIMGFGLIHAVPTSNEAMDLLDTLTLRAYSEAYTADTWATHATPHPADDLYPLGAIAYELLTGTHPFGRHSLTSARQKQLAYEPVPDLNRRAAKLLARCLSFDRVERPKNAARFVKALREPLLMRWFAALRTAD